MWGSCAYKECKSVGSCMCLQGVYECGDHVLVSTWPHTLKLLVSSVRVWGHVLTRSVRVWGSCAYKVQGLQSSIRCKSFHVFPVKSFGEVGSFPETQLRKELK